MQGDRARTWELLAQPWDMVVIGGGITGAGILWEATRQGYRTLLVEQRDFAWGTSSRSGKLVHGGLRYLKQGQVRVTWHSVRERERLLRDLPGLVIPLGILLPVYRGDPVGATLLKIGLVLYDLMAMRPGHRYHAGEEFARLAVHARTEGLLGGFSYGDALTDDARLVLRVIGDAIRMGGTALNYVRVEDLCRSARGPVEGVVLRDVVTGRAVEVRAQVVVNAAGIWVDELRARLGKRRRLRLLRGSHLVFPAARLPVIRGMNVFHPSDGRPLYVLPWEGVTLVGTTDVDHAGDLEGEPRMSTAEFEYLLGAAQHQFPSLGLTGEDVLATFSGVRPVVGTGKRDPSKEPRDYVVWVEEMVTVAGGKLTTFLVLARDAVRRAQGRLGPAPRGRIPARLGAAPDARGGNQYGEDRPAHHLREGVPEMDDAVWVRLVGRYGPDAPDLVCAAGPGELEPVPGTNTLWAELRWAARSEAVVHLDDLLLRRVRLGIQLPQGGIPLLERVRPLVLPALGWDDARWNWEVARYKELWHSAYSPSPAAGNPSPGSSLAGNPSPGSSLAGNPSPGGGPSPATGSGPSPSRGGR